MLGNRTRSSVARARHVASATAQNVAANVVRVNSDAAVASEALVPITEASIAQQEQLAELSARVGDLEETP